MLLFKQKLEQESFDDFAEEIYVLEGAELVKQEGEDDAEHITPRDE